MKTRKILAFALALTLIAALLAGCKTDAKTEKPASSAQPTTTAQKPEPTETPAQTAAPTTTAEPSVETDPAGELFRFTRDNFPRLDGSTACIPLGEAVASVLLGESRESVQDLVQFNRTTQSFRNLMSDSCDLLLVGQPNAAVFDEMKQAGFEYDMETLGRDGLVFLVNESNPVDSLTTEQIRDIYTGKITNWKEVGGADAEILPIQRNEGAGSQALMKKLVMQDTPLMEAPVEYVATSMGELMSVVKSYDTSANAIGYSVYYYAHDMEMAKGLKLLKVDGVEPNKDTIRERTYPHLNDYYFAALNNVSPSELVLGYRISEDVHTLQEAQADYGRKRQEIIDAYEERIAKLNQEIKNLNQQISDLRDSIDTKKDVIAMLRGRLRDHGLSDV